MMPPVGHLWSLQLDVTLMDCGLNSEQYYRNEAEDSQAAAWGQLHVLVITHIADSTEALNKHSGFIQGGGEDGFRQPLS